MEAVTEAGIDGDEIVADLESFDPPGVLVDPGVFHALWRPPLVTAPDILAEGAVLCGEAGDGMRANHAPRELVTTLHLVEPRRDALAAGQDPGVADLVDLGDLL